jgi:hypothetical protein
MIQPVTIPEGTLVIGVARKDDSELRLLDCEAVMSADLLPLRDETWWRGVRAGQLPLDWRGLSLRVVPGQKIGPCFRGFSLELSDGRRRFAHRFSVHSLRDAAQRPIARLLEQKELKADDTVNYFLLAAPRDNGGPALAAVSTSAIKATPRASSLILEEGSLAEHLAASHPLTAGWAAPPENPAATGSDAMTVIFTPEAWENGHRYARRGKDVESAAVWTGRLVRDSASGDVFALVDACLEAQHAAEDRYSVTFSGDTWGRVRALLDQRRAQLHRPHEIILGSVHGHNFAPAADEKGRQTCDACELRPTCSRTTAVASALDVGWHKSVFSGQPYAVLGIWGWTARGEEVWQLYGLAEGTLAPRGARLLQRVPR